MRTKRGLYLSVAAIALALALGTPGPASAQQAAPPSIGSTDIGGVVTGPKGPEAGVWVIAETTDLPTKMNKIVVTDDQGRYVIPDLPKANYTVWARGYGLVDSAKTQSEPGKIVNITAIPAPTEAAAAQYYPAIYWFSMLKIPDKNMFPGTGPNGNGMATLMKSQLQWMDQVKTNGCYACHQLGNKATREIPKELGTFKNSTEAWERRVQSGQAMTGMAAALGRQDPKVAIANLADWTDRIAAGELPFAKPERPQGLERNVVVTQWDWGDQKAYMHDQVSTDKRKPTINRLRQALRRHRRERGLVPDLRSEHQPADPRDDADPRQGHGDRPRTTPWRRPPIGATRRSGTPRPACTASSWMSAATSGTPRASAIRRTRSSARQARIIPPRRRSRSRSSTRHLAMYDPKTGKTTLVRTCFNTHHVVLAEDPDNTLWVSAGGPQQGAIGWVNRRILEETGDEAKAQGWAPVIIDTNGNGKADDYVQPNQAVDPTKDKRLNAGLYGVGVNPSDGTVWGAVLGYPGYVLRFDPKTKLSEVYEPPFPGFGPRGFDIDRNGVAYVPLSSGHLAAFDRRKCKGPLNGPQAAEGKLCPEGWTLTPFPGPQFKNVAENGSAEASYYTWVDQQNTFGLGDNVPLATGNANESLMALVDGKWINMRIPYPLGFFAKWIDGRIDDPNGGWKGRALWSTDGNRTPFHRETGKGTLPKIVKFQMRPDPLAH